jgi:hypothetical protein
MSEDYSSTSSATRPRSRRHLPILLIVFGVLILAANAGPVGSVLWSVAWPIGLIAVGIDLITEGRQRRRIAVGALVGMIALTPLIGGARWINAGRAQLQGGADAPSLALQNVDRVQARVTQPWGDLHIEALPDDSPDVARVDREGLVESYTTDDRIGMLEVSPGRQLRGDELNLELTRRVPLDLTIDLATGSDRELNLEELQLEKLNLNVQAGDATVKLPRRGVMDINISGLVSDLEIEVPDDLPARIVVDSTISDIEYDEDRFREEDGVLVSNDYNDSAPNRATINISTGAGDIEIK